MRHKNLFLATLIILASVSGMLYFQACKGSADPGKEYSMPFHFNESDDLKLLEKAKSVFAHLPDTMRGSSADTKELIMLGDLLYYETLLSINNKQSCNSCHPIDQNNAGADHEVTGIGTLGQQGTRNDPSTLNAGFQLSLFWDGRAKSLEEQAKMPILNPMEMAMPDEASVISRLKAEIKYKDAFSMAFPGQANPINFNNLTKAIAAFERTLISKGRMDRYLAGNLEALTKEEKKGLKTFMEVGCTQCHVGNNFGGMIYHKMGLYHPYQNKKDLGRYAVTKNEGDKYVFKVPILRNVILTGPYFHDGAVSNLKDAIDTMGHLQLDKKLSSEEIRSIQTFLNSLTDEKISTVNIQSH